MTEIPPEALTIKLESTGEQLSMWRTIDPDGIPELQMVGCLPRKQPGPPMHIHFAEDESTEVIHGEMSVSLDGRKSVIKTTGSAFFPKGSVHRWWNDGEDDLKFRGVAKPAVDLDCYLVGLFDVINAAGSQRPSFFYMAHLMYRHRKTQFAFGIPSWIQRVLFPCVIALGWALGKFRGQSWPGCPERCKGAPFVSNS